MIQMREEIEEAKKEKAREYRRAYYKEYQAKNLEKCREYERQRQENTGQKRSYNKQQPKIKYQPIAK